MFNVHVIKKPVLIHEALAFEQVLFSTYLATGDAKTSNKKAKDVTILFWRSLDAVVCGRNQLPWLECDFVFMKKKGINFARRDSGGGTVYHDAGNLNICVISNMSKNAHQKDSVKKNLQTLVAALKKSHNIQAQVTAKNDIFVPKENQKNVRGKKITGSAMRIVQGHILHHFTVLLQTDLSCAKKALSASKNFNFNTTAVRSRVQQITNIHCSAELIIKAYIEQIEEHKRKKVKVKTYNSIKKAVLYTKTQNLYNQNYTRLISDVWLYGRSPKYNIIVPLEEENTEAEVMFLEGKIVEVRLYYKKNSGVMYAVPITSIYMDEKSLKRACVKTEEHDIIRQVAHKLYRAYYETETDYYRDSVGENCL